MQTLNLYNKQYQLPTIKESIPTLPTVDISDLPTIQNTTPIIKNTIPIINKKQNNNSKQISSSESPYVNIDDPTQVNSFLDVVSNAFDPVDNGGHIFSFAELVSSGKELFKNWIYNPLKEGNLTALGWNTLMNMGESIDIVYNIIKATMSIENTTAKNYKFKSIEDRVKAATGYGVKGRYNFDWDLNISNKVGKVAVDMLAETFLDPFTYLSFGTSALLKGSIKSSKVATTVAERFTNIVKAIPGLNTLKLDNNFGYRMIESYLSKNNKLKTNLITELMSNLNIKLDAKDGSGVLLYNQLNDAFTKALTTSEEQATHILNKDILKTISKDTKELKNIELNKFIDDINLNASDINKDILLKAINESDKDVLLRHLTFDDDLNKVKKLNNFFNRLEWVDNTYIKICASFFTPIFYATKFTSKKLWHYSLNIWRNIDNKYKVISPDVIINRNETLRKSYLDLKKSGVIEDLSEKEFEEIKNISALNKISKFMHNLQKELLSNISSYDQITSINIEEIVNKVLDICDLKIDKKIETLDDIINLLSDSIKVIKDNCDNFKELDKQFNISSTLSVFRKINKLYEAVQIYNKIDLFNVVKDEINDILSFSKIELEKDIKYTKNISIASGMYSNILNKTPLEASKRIETIIKLIFNKKIANEILDTKTPTQAVLIIEDKLDSIIPDALNKVSGIINSYCGIINDLRTLKDVLKDNNLLNTTNLQELFSKEYDMIKFIDYIDNYIYYITNYKTLNKTALNSYKKNLNKLSKKLFKRSFENHYKSYTNIVKYYNTIIYYIEYFLQNINLNVTEESLINQQKKIDKLGDIKSVFNKLISPKFTDDRIKVFSDIFTSQYAIDHGYDKVCKELTPEEFNKEKNYIIENIKDSFLYRLLNNQNIVGENTYYTTAKLEIENLIKRLNNGNTIDNLLECILTFKDNLKNLFEDSLTYDSNNFIKIPKEDLITAYKQSTKYDYNKQYKYKIGDYIYSDNFDDLVYFEIDHNQDKGYKYAKEVSSQYNNFEPETFNYKSKKIIDEDENIRHYYKVISVDDAYTKSTFKVLDITNDFYPIEKRSIKLIEYKNSFEKIIRDSCNYLNNIKNMSTSFELGAKDTLIQFKIESVKRTMEYVYGETANILNDLVNGVETSGFFKDLDTDNILKPITEAASKRIIWQQIFSQIDLDTNLDAATKTLIIDKLEAFGNLHPSALKEYGTRYNFIRTINDSIKMKADFKSISLDTLRSTITDKSIANDKRTKEIVAVIKQLFNNDEKSYNDFINNIVINGHDSYSDAVFTEVAIRVYNPELAKTYDNLESVYIYDTEATGLNVNYDNILSISVHKWGDISNGNYKNKPLFNEQIKLKNSVENRQRYKINEELITKFHFKNESEYINKYFSSSTNKITSDNVIDNFIKFKTKNNDCLFVSYNGDFYDNQIISRRLKSFNLEDDPYLRDAYEETFYLLNKGKAKLTIDEVNSINEILTLISNNLEGFDSLRNFSDIDSDAFNRINDILNNRANQNFSNELISKLEQLKYSYDKDFTKYQNINAVYFNIFEHEVKDSEIPIIQEFLKKESPNSLYKEFNNLSPIEKRKIRNMMLLYQNDFKYSWKRKSDTFNRFYYRMNREIKDANLSNIYNLLYYNTTESEFMVKYLLRSNKPNFLKDKTFITDHVLNQLDNHLDNIYRYIEYRIKNLDEIFGQDKIFENIDELRNIVSDIIENGKEKGKLYNKKYNLRFETDDTVDKWYRHLDINKITRPIELVAIYLEITDDLTVKYPAFNRILKEEYDGAYKDLLNTASSIERDTYKILDIQNSLDAIEKLSVLHSSVTSPKKYIYNLVLKDLLDINKILKDLPIDSYDKYMANINKSYISTYLTKTRNLLTSFTNPENIVNYLLFTNPFLVIKKNALLDFDYVNITKNILKNKNNFKQYGINLIENNNKICLFLDINVSKPNIDYNLNKATFNGKEYTKQLDKEIYNLYIPEDSDPVEKYILSKFNNYLTKQANYTGFEHVYYGDIYTKKDFYDQLKNIKKEFNIKEDTIFNYVNAGFFNNPRFSENILGYTDTSILITSNNTYCNSYTPITYLLKQLEYCVNNDKAVNLFVDVFTNKEFGSTMSSIFKNIDINDDNEISKIANAFKNNNDTVAVTIISDKFNHQGFIADAIDLTTKEGVRKAFEMDAALVPYSAYSNMFEAINNNSNAYTKFDKIARKVMYLYKLGYLTSIGAVVRNMFDAYIKSVIETNDIKGYSNNLIKAIKIDNEYNKIIKDYFIYTTNGTTNYSDASLTTRAITEFYNKFKDIKGYSLSLEEFQFAHEFLHFGSSVGEASALSNFSKSKSFSGNSLLNKIGDTLLMPNAFVERVNRLAEYFTLIEKGYSKSTTFAKIAHSQFDYANKDIITKYVEYLIPFFNYTKNNVFFWMDVLLDNPFLIKIIDDVFGVTVNEFDFDIDEYERNRSLQYHIMNGSITLTDDNLVLKFNPSYLDALNLIIDPGNNLISKVFTPFKNIYNATFAEGALLSQLDNPTNDPWEDIIKPFFSTTLGQHSSYPFVGALYNKLHTAMNTASNNKGGTAQKIIGSAIPSLFSNVKRWDNYKYENTYINNLPETKLRSNIYNSSYYPVRSYNYYYNYSYVSNRLNYSYSNIYKQYKRLKYLRYKVSGVWEG